MTKTLFACLAGLVGVLLIGFASTAAMAQDGFTPWRAMQAGANPPTIAAARQQCLAAGVSAGECNAFAAMLDQGACKQVTVPDGTSYRWLGGQGGKISRHKAKQLGGNTVALRCELPSGRTLDWYAKSVTGAGACNNVGELAVATSSQLRMSKPTVEYHAPEVTLTPGQLIELGCPTCCGTETLYLPGTRVVTPRSPSTSRRLQFD